MRQIGEAVERNRLRETYNTIFTGTDPYCPIFTDIAVERIILCPTNGYWLDNAQFAALLGTAKCSGEEHCFVSLVDGDDDPFAVNYHWQMDVNTTYYDYRSTPTLFYNAIYSPSGQWGLIISDEQYALLGGSREFMQKFKSLYPQYSEGIEQFLKKWDHNFKMFPYETDWMEPLLHHMYYKGGLRNG